MAEMVFTAYHDVKDQILTGDCFAWYAKGGTPLYRLYGRLINIFAGPVTHISTAVWANYGSSSQLQVWESVEQGQVFDSLERRLATAIDDNLVAGWWLPMSAERRERLDEQAMIDYMLRKCSEGTPYDLHQAIKSALDKHARQHSEPDDSELFCSESYLFALLNGGAIVGCNPSEAHPTDVVSFNIHGPVYYQIYGDTPMELPNVGTVEVDNWDI